MASDKQAEPVSVNGVGENLEGAPSLSHMLFPERATSDDNMVKVPISEQLVSLASTKVINQRAFANEVGIPIGCVVNCLPPSATKLPELRKAPVCCNNCGAFIHPFCRVEVQSGRWKCTFCGLVGVAPGELGGAELQVRPELTNEAVDYRDESLQGSVAMHSASDVPPHAAVVLVLDATLDAQNMDPVRAAVKKVVKGLHPDTDIAIISFDSCVSLYSLDGRPGLVESHTLPGHIIHLPTGARKILTPHRPKLVKIKTCVRMVEAVLDSICAQKTSIPEKTRPRCLGTALHEALMLLQLWRKEAGSVTSSGRAVRVSTERLLVMTGGVGTYGPGAIPLNAADGEVNKEEEIAFNEGIGFFSRLAGVAQGMGVVIDLYGVGPSSIGVALLEPLARASGGGLTMHTSLNSALLTASIEASLSRTFGSAGMMDVRLSPGLKLVSIIGQVSERLNTAESGVRKVSSNACMIQKMEMGKGFGLWVQATRDFGHEDLYVQVVLNWKNAEGYRVERVVTRQLTPTGNLAEFLQSVNPVTASVLLAKKLVLEMAQSAAKNDRRREQDIRLGLPVRLNYLAQKFGRLLERKSGFFGFGQTQKWSCPQELTFLAQSLYHLQRGPVFGSSLVHPEERSLLQSIVLSASLSAAEAMLVPKFYAFDTPSATFEEVPPIDVALRNDNALVLDNGTHMYIWIGDSIDADQPSGGAATSPDRMESNHDRSMSQSEPTRSPPSTSNVIHACEKFAVDLAKGRFPVPDLMIVRQSGPQSDIELLLSKLVPVSRDGEEDARIQMGKIAPPPGSINWEAVPAAAPDDPPSFYKWCRDANVEPPRFGVVKSRSLSRANAS